MWRNVFGGGFGPVVRQNTELINSYPEERLTTKKNGETVGSAQSYIKYCQQPDKISKDITAYIRKFSRDLKLFVFIGLFKGSRSVVPVVYIKTTMD